MDIDDIISEADALSHTDMDAFCGAQIQATAILIRRLAEIVKENNAPLHGKKVAD